METNWDELWEAAPEPDPQALEWDTLWEEAPEPTSPPKKSPGKIGKKKKKIVRKGTKGGAPEGNKNASQSLHKYILQNYSYLLNSKKGDVDVIWWLEENEEKLKNCKGDFFSEKTFDGEIRKNLEFSDAIESVHNSDYIGLE